MPESNDQTGSQRMPSAPAFSPSWNDPVAAVAEVRRAIERVRTEIHRTIVGQDEVVDQALLAILCGGHAVVEGVPGLAKTLLVSSLSKTLSLHFSRIQFTPDLMPSDMTGTEVIQEDKVTGSRGLRFVKGPIFANIVLADEINRTPPKTQSALLEAMAERQVTVEGETRPLPGEFFVIATQNPASQAGTFPLPESQLDRFLMRIEIGYPERAAERAMLSGGPGSRHVESLVPGLSREELAAIHAGSQAVHTADMLLDYVQRLTEYTRTSPEFVHGLSPRGAIALVAAARTWAFMEGRSHVVPEDVQAVLPAVVSHRLRGAGEQAGDGRALAERMLTRVDVFG